MSVTISSTLEAHQRGTARVPRLFVKAYATRFGNPVCRWTRWYSGAEADDENAACLTAAGTLLRFRNNGGDLQLSRVVNPSSGSTYSSWSTIAAGAMGAPRSLCAAAKDGEAIVVYSRGNTIYYRTSSNDGASWSGEATAVSVGAANDFPSFAYNHTSGDGCLFFETGGVVHRCRRTAGAFAGASTAWTNSVASVSGLAAVHDGNDYVVIVAGTQVGTGHPRVWNTAFGDGANYASNAWSALTELALADASSTTTFRRCAAAVTGPNHTVRAGFIQRESAAPAYDRLFESHPPFLTLPTQTWAEPWPTEATGAEGFAYAWYPGASSVFLTSPFGVWHAPLGESADLTDMVSAARVRIEADAARCEVELTDAEAVVGAVPRPGDDIDVWPGYTTTAGHEYGVLWRFNVESVRHHIGRAGRRLVTLEASGPWEALARWEAPQAWAAQAGTILRSALVARIAARAAAINVVSETGAEAPSAQWTSYSPAFYLAAGEPGDIAIARLMNVTKDVVRADSEDMAIRGLSDSTAAEGFDFQPSPDEHPLSSLEVRDAPRAVNWYRAVGGSDAVLYADAFDFAGIYAVGPRRAQVRNLDAATATKVQEAADAGVFLYRLGRFRPVLAANRGQEPLSRRLRRQARASLDDETAAAAMLVAPWNARLELFDIVEVADARLFSGSRTYRVSGLGLDYLRVAPGGRCRYDAVLELSEVTS